MRQGLTWLLGFAGCKRSLDADPTGDLVLRDSGCDETGPLNLHFIRDIGCAYLVAAAGLLWMASRPREA